MTDIFNLLAAATMPEQVKETKKGKAIIKKGKKHDNTRASK